MHYIGCLTCNERSKYHGDGHIVMLGKQIPEIVFDHDTPPEEMAYDGRQCQTQGPTVASKQLLPQTCIIVEFPNGLCVAPR